MLVRRLLLTVAYDYASVLSAPSNQAEPGEDSRQERDDVVVRLLGAFVCPVVIYADSSSCEETSPLISSMMLWADNSCRSYHSCTVSTTC